MSVGAPGLAPPSVGVATSPPSVTTLGKAVAASEIGGGRLIVVDAIDDEAQSFYEHYHFISVRNRERRLVMKVSTAAKALGQRWRE
jgi:hypothetical protein